MFPLICISGVSGSGKTTLIEKLLPELSRRGLRVATIKHDAHGFEIDHPGKDSYRHQAAGSVSTVLFSSQRLAVISDLNDRQSLTPREICDLYFRDDVDLVLCEGFKQEILPKVEVFRAAVAEKPFCSKDHGLLALVTDDDVHADVPVFSSADIPLLADFICEQAKTQVQARQIALYINNRPVSLKPFIRDLLINTLIGILSALKGGNEMVSADIRLRIEDKTEKPAID